MPMVTNDFSPARQHEVHRDFGFHFEGLVVQEVRAVPPLPDRFNRGFDQHRVSANHRQILDRSCLADDRPQLDRALNARLACDWRIAGLDAVDDVALRPVRYPQGLDRGWVRRNHYRYAVSEAMRHAVAWSATRSTADGWEFRRRWNRVRIVNCRDLKRYRSRRDERSLGQVVDCSGCRMRVRSLCCRGWCEGCGRSEPLQPMQLRWPLNPDQRDCEQQAQSKGLHGEGCERSPSATGGVVPVAFECAEHNVSSGTGPLFRTDTCALRFDPERTRKELSWRSDGRPRPTLH